MCDCKNNEICKECLEKYDQILEDIKGGNCITTDCKTYTVCGHRGKVLHKLTDEQVQELIKLGKVKLVEQTRTYRVEVI